MLSQQPSHIAFNQKKKKKKKNQTQPSHIPKRNHLHSLPYIIHFQLNQTKPNQRMPDADNSTTTIKTSSPSWAELLGSNHWSGLLDPLDLSLIKLILLCGDLCQVTYDAFDSDAHSRYCGASRYGTRSLLAKTLFPFAPDYNVHSFLYATSQLDIPLAFLYSLSREAWSKESNWIGYVAVSSDGAARATGRRDVFVAWRGTIRDLEWSDVLELELVPITPVITQDDEGCKVMKGWYTVYTSSDDRSPFNKTSARDQLLSSIRTIVETYKDEEGTSLSIVCVGHSLGASLSILSAFDIVSNGLSTTGDPDNTHFPVTAVVFGSPQVGNKEFNEKLQQLPNLRVLHVRNKPDLIPRYPTRLLGYEYTGVELVVDTRKSPYLKDSKNPSDWHNLQAILQSVAGWNGEDGKFEWRVKRSVGLVNKSCDYLKDECLVPASWWVERNKGMAVGEDGEWRLAALDPDDVPAPPNGDGSSFSTVVVKPPPPLVPDDVDGKKKKKKANSGTGINKLASCFRAGN